MSEPDAFPTPSPGALELLRITVENDRHRVIARNAALIAAFRWLTRLHETSLDSFVSLPALFGTQRIPRNLLELTCAIILRVQTDLDQQFDAGQTEGSRLLASDFNRHVFQALAETLADIAAPQRSAQDFDGPSVSQFSDRLSRMELYEVLESLIRNYLGDILQECFADARIRETVPDLEDDAELKLRSEEAAQIARFVMQTAFTQEANPGVEVILAELHATLQKLGK
jgi:hypothetical protein